MNIYPLLRYHAMMTYGGLEAYLHSFLTSELGGDAWSASRLGLFNPQQDRLGGWVVPRASSEEVAR